MSTGESGLTLSYAVIELESGNWCIDVRVGKKRMSLEYRPKQGFGMFARDSSYGEGPTDVYRTANLAARRVVQLFAARKEASAPLTLKTLRELYGLQQVDIAQRIGVKQSAISRSEQRKEVKLGTIESLVKAMGGTVEVRAHFPDSDVKLLAGG
jgi:DNA-binding XRE family transcriptional regulator